MFWEMIRYFYMHCEFSIFLFEIFRKIMHKRHLPSSLLLFFNHTSISLGKRHVVGRRCDGHQVSSTFPQKFSFPGTGWEADRQNRKMFCPCRANTILYSSSLPAVLHQEVFVLYDLSKKAIRLCKVSFEVLFMRANTIKKDRVV